MNLLRDIQDGATEDTVSLSTLLHKAKLLGARLGVKEIAQWAERELSGYDQGVGPRAKLRIRNEKEEK